jgi:pimeloyl-ACP methyl ester carboxylesterase
MDDRVLEHRYDMGEVELNFAEVPAAAPTLVMLHGGSARWQTFAGIIPDLAARWHLYMPDFRGHGRSGRARGRYRLADFAADTCALLTARVTEPAILFGHSLGGGVALMVAAQCPDRVVGVIVGDAPLDKVTWEDAIQTQRSDLLAWRALSGGSVPLAAVIEALKNAPSWAGDAHAPRMRDLLGEDHPLFPALAENLYAQDPEFLTMILDDFELFAAGYDMRTLLPAIRCPVLLLQADPAAGAVMSDAEVQEALALLSQGAHVQLSGISHVFHNERPDPVVEAINNWDHGSWRST